ncbi:hypothetical protein ISS06_00600 [Patescibacteria group bacterium]|nr:hypothetical protein [Patescibacteria group bacterium]
MECQQNKNIVNCPCTYPGCPRKGVCCECIKYHNQRKELPACVFSKQAEATYDRTIEKFIQDQK